MALHLRQICLVAEDLAATVAKIEAVFATPNCFSDPGVHKFGLENALMTFGTQFLEVVAPTRANTSAERFLKRRGGDGGYMVIAQVNDLEEQDALRARAEGQNVRLVYERDRGDWRIMQFHPADMGAAYLEVDWDEYNDVEGNWNSAGGIGWEAKANRDLVGPIVGAELQAEDPQVLSVHWSAITGLPVEQRAGTPTIRFANADLRFVKADDGRGAGLSAIDVQVNDRAALLAAARQEGLTVSGDQLTICGTRFNLIGAAVQAPR